MSVYLSLTLLSAAASSIHECLSVTDSSVCCATHPDSVATPPASATRTNRPFSGKTTAASPEKLPGEAPFIPFAQRQAKSQVAAREILKMGEKVQCSCEQCSCQYCIYAALKRYIPCLMRFV